MDLFYLFLMKFFSLILFLPARGPWRSSRAPSRGQLTSLSRWALKTLALSSQTMTGNCSLPCMRYIFVNELTKEGCVYNRQPLQGIVVCKTENQTRDWISHLGLFPLFGIRLPWVHCVTCKSCSYLWLWNSSFCLGLNHCSLRSPGGARLLYLRASQVPRCHHSQPGAVRSSL